MESQTPKAGLGWKVWVGPWSPILLMGSDTFSGWNWDFSEPLGQEEMPAQVTAVGVTDSPRISEASAMWQRSPWGQPQPKPTGNSSKGSSAGTRNVCVGSLSRDWKQHTQTKQPAQQPSREKPKFTREPRGSCITSTAPVQSQGWKFLHPPWEKKVEKFSLLMWKKETSSRASSSRDPSKAGISVFLNLTNTAKIMQHFIWI